MILKSFTGGWRRPLEELSVRGLPRGLAALAAIACLAICAAAGLGEAEQGPLYNVTLVTDRAPDFTDIGSYLNSITGQYSSPQEKAIGIWRWSQRLRKQTGYPTEGGSPVLDPILLFTSYGYTQCGIIAGVNNSLWLNMGWKARYVQLGDHTVGEVSWDEGKTWHMFDNSMSFYCFNDEGQVASVTEIENNPRYYLENFAPECGTNPVSGVDDHAGWRQASDHPVEYERTLAAGMDSFLPPNELHEDHLAIKWGRRYAINLRPGESYTRNFRNLDSASPDGRYYRPLRGKDPQEHSGHRNIRGNGVWIYRPDLTSPETRNLVFSESGLQWTSQGVRPSGESGQVVFKVSAANVIASARVRASGRGVRLSVSRDCGIGWIPIAGESPADPAAELIEEVGGALEYLVRAELPAKDSLLSGVEIQTVTQMNRPSLPRLGRGRNRIQVRMGEQGEELVLSPPLAAGNHRETVHEEEGLSVNPRPYFNVATLRAGEGGKPCYATWRIESPTPISGVIYGGNVCVKSAGDRASLKHSWDGLSYVEDFGKTRADFPFDSVVYREIAGEDIPADQRVVYLRYEFETPDATQQWRAPGIQSALMRVRHATRAAGEPKLQVTYCWVERNSGGEKSERRHTELISSPAHEYSIEVGGDREPEMKWVRMNLPGHAPNGEDAAYGYSGAPRMKTRMRPGRELYRWGRNLALGKPYSLEGMQDERNPDEGGDLTDGVIAPPDTHVSRKFVPTNVMFAADVSPVILLDLGARVQIAAVRVSAGQEGGFRLSYPDSLTVETSIDGRKFARRGESLFSQVFQPPADYAPWELDDAAQFEHLPAGGRLAYSYRIIFRKPKSARFVRVTCSGREGWGMMLSEIQVFDRVEVLRDVPPLVCLPPVRTP